MREFFKNPCHADGWVKSPIIITRKRKSNNPSFVTKPFALLSNGENHLYIINNDKATLFKIPFRSNNCFIP